VLVVTAQLAAAAPRTPAAKQEFDRGVKLYQQKKFAEAALAFKTSLDVETDTETIFALAQSYRQEGKCKAANTYYDMLLEEKSLPAANRTAITAAKNDCVEQLSDGSDTVQPDPSEGSASDGSAHVSVEVDKPVDTHHWYQETAGDLMAGGGVVGLALGATFYSLSRSEHDKLANITDEGTFLATKDRAQTYYDVSWGCVIGGGVLLVSGLSWYLSHTGEEAKPRKRRAAVTGWVHGGGVGVTVLGQF
jgi:hypothetical protein